MAAKDNTTTPLSNGVISSSMFNTPQAVDDTQSFTEDQLSSATSPFLIDVMSNDGGGNAKTLWSVNAGTEASNLVDQSALQDLTTADVNSAGVATEIEYTDLGARFWIQNGKIAYDPSTIRDYNSWQGGEVHTDTITYAIRLANGTISLATLTINITGSNDGIQITSGPQKGAVVEDAGDTPSTTDSTSASGTINFTDADLADAHTATFVPKSSNTTSLGTFTLDPVSEAANTADGALTWHYELSSTASQSLAAGETVVECFTVSISDGHGSIVTKDVAITITGTNDAPTVTGPLDDAADEGDAAFNVDLLDGASDVDHGATLSVTDVTYSVDGGDASDVAPAGLQLAGSVLTVDPSDAAFDHLAAGQIQTIVVSFKVSDEHGASHTQTETITITGTNDTPVAVADTNSGNEDTTISGNVSSNDSDSDDGAVLSYTLDAPVAGLTLNPDGTYSFDAAHAAYQHLAQGATATVVASYTVTDEHNATSSATLTITLTGTNDGPTVTAALTASADEGDASFTRNLLAGASDPDSGETATLSVINVSYAVDGGAASSTAPAGVSLSGATLSVDPTDAAFNHLAVGQSQVVVVSYQVRDAQGATVDQTETITIHGTNDAPTVTAALTASADEGDASFTRNLLAGASDPDSGETATLSVINVNYAVDGGAASSTAPAGVSLSGATLSVDPTDAAFNHLAVGQSQVVVVSYQVRDAQGATVDQTETITIHGTNDAPTDIALSGTTIAEHATGTVGALTTTDVDTADTHAYSIVGGTGQSLFAISGGNLVVNAGIELSPEANKNYTLDIRTNDGHGGVYTETFTVTVTNDTADDVVIATLPPTSTGPDSSDSGVTGASSSSAITGNNDGNLLYGHTGGDKINGNGGNDTIYGGAGNDTINGNSESDIIYGGSGNDSIDGGNGNDTLIGGTGADSVTGGSDSDWIRYLTLQDTNDVITGFTRGTDKIDLTAIDANAATGANDTFGFVAAAVSDVIVQANSVTWQQNGANVEVYADTDGDLTTAEFHITLLNVTGLSASDFDTL